MFKHLSLHVSIGNPTAYNDGTYVKTSMTQLKPEEGVHLQITSFNQYGFLINGNIRILGPIAIFPKTIFSWNISDISDINEKSLLLFKMLEPKIGNLTSSLFHTLFDIKDDNLFFVFKFK